MTGEPMAVGLVGCGAVVHSIYGKLLTGRSEYNVRYVADIDRQRAAEAAAVFGAEAVDIDDLADRSDAVVVTTPPSTHASLVRRCLRPGRILLCEKPYMTKYTDAVAALEEARVLNARLCVSHFRRMFPQLELARELIGLGVIGDITSIAASEGGRFTWRAASEYPTRDPAGGVLWDTGSHTVDMALFAAGLDGLSTLAVTDVSVKRDKAEPSHDFAATFKLAAGCTSIAVRLHVSRRETPPNLIRIVGSRGSVAFVTNMDQRIRLTTDKGSLVLVAERRHANFLECFDLQLRRVLLTDGPSSFDGELFLGQVQLLEALANA